MIEIVLLDYLTKHLDVPVYPEEPAQKPPSYVLFERTGGDGSRGLFHSTFAFQSYGASLHEAAKLNARVVEILETCPALEAFAGAKLNSQYNFTDTETKRYRYQAVFDFAHY